VLNFLAAFERGLCVACFCSLSGVRRHACTTFWNSGSFVGSDLAMPPQPITRIISNPTVDFDPAKLATVPHLTALPMAVIAIWGAIDGNLAKMLSHIVGSDFAIVVAMLHALRNQDSQRSAIFGAAEKALPSDDYSLLKAVDKVTKASRDRRHEYAHHLWGIPNIPDALALLNPRDGLPRYPQEQLPHVPRLSFYGCSI
jgi:hypothetical protein